MGSLRFDLRPTLVRGLDVTAQTSQSDGALRVAGVHPGMGASKIWLGQVSNEPAYRSVPHHHAEAETAGYVLEGKARIYFGPEYAEYFDLEAGDFVHVPAWMPHIECNRSRDARLIWMTARTPDNIVVNLDDIDLPPSRYTT